MLLLFGTGANAEGWGSIKGRFVWGPSDLGIAADIIGEAGAQVKRVDYFVPELGEGAEILEGSMEEMAEKLIELLKAKGGIK